MMLPYEAVIMLKLNSLPSILIELAKIASNSVYVMIPLVILLAFRESKKKSVLTAVALTITVAIGTLLKDFIEEPRPSFEGLNSHITATESSFPSRHAMMSFVSAGLSPVNKKLFYAWATIISISRVVLGVHYIHDIIVGAIIGYIIAKIASKYISS